MLWRRTSKFSKGWNKKNNLHLVHNPDSATRYRVIFQVCQLFKVVLSKIFVVKRKGKWAEEILVTAFPQKWNNNNKKIWRWFRGEELIFAFHLGKILKKCTYNALQPIVILACHIPTFRHVPLASYLNAEGTLWRRPLTPKASPTKACIHLVRF